MWRQWSLCLLYLLQVIVLSGTLTGYILTTQALPSHTNQRAGQLGQTSPGQGRSSVSKVKPSVKMKPMPMSYMKENPQRASPSLGAARLSMNSKLEDHQLLQVMSRPARSPAYSSNHRAKRHQMTKHHEPVTHPQIKDDIGFDETNEHVDEFVKKHDNEWEVNIHEYSTDNIDGHPALDETISIEEREDADYVYDYPRDEPAQDDLEAFESALHHIEEVRTCSLSRCRDPMPFVLAVKDPHHQGRDVLPSCVVLHRCMNYTGCCGGPNHECVPKSMSVVTKAFLIVQEDSEPGHPVVFSPNMATTITFVNHTACECREKVKPPRCTKACPHQFHLIQEGALCRCDCLIYSLQDSWYCESVKDGVAPLPQAEQDCILNGSCYSPDCTAGNFDPQSGLCPLSDEYALPAFLFDDPNQHRHYRGHLRNYNFTNSRPVFTGNNATQNVISLDRNDLNRNTTGDKKRNAHSQPHSCDSESVENCEPDFVSVNAQSNSTLNNTVQLSSSSENEMNEEPIQSSDGDKLRRESSEENLFKHKLQFNSRNVQEYPDSVEVSPMSKNFLNLQSNKDPLKNHHQSTTESLTVVSLSSTLVPLSQKLSSSSRTYSSYLQSDPTQAVSNHAKSSGHMHSKKSYYKRQLEKFFNYDYSTYDGSGDEFR